MNQSNTVVPLNEKQPVYIQQDNNPLVLTKYLKQAEGKMVAIFNNKAARFDQNPSFQFTTTYAQPDPNQPSIFTIAVNGKKDKIKDDNPQMYYALTQLWIAVKDVIDGEPRQILEEPINAVLAVLNS